MNAQHKSSPGGTKASLPSTPQFQLGVGHGSIGPSLDLPYFYSEFSKDS